jgi:hypothetical protein
MFNRFLVCLGAVLAVVIPASSPGQAVPGKNSAPAWQSRRLPDGQPDLQGIWTNATITPMERPAEFAGKPFMTEQEAAEYEKNYVQHQKESFTNDVNGPLRLTWWDSGSKVVQTRRTSIVIDPPDGKIPPLTPQAQTAERVRRAATRSGHIDTVADRPLNERCIIWPTDGPPMMSSFYNNNYRIVQSPGYVAIYIEMVHDVRMIPLDGRPHVASNIRSWMGDSVGHWEGDTLIIDTTNFNGRTSFRGSDENLHVIERFRRTAEHTLLYQFTIDDPSAFTQPWTGEVPWLSAPGPLYEYDCHEGNFHSMASMLKTARSEEAKQTPDSKKR